MSPKVRYQLLAKKIYPLYGNKKKNERKREEESEKERRTVGMIHVCNILIIASA